MNVKIITDSVKNAKGSRANLLNNSLVLHASEGLEAHDAEGPVSYTFTDSGGNSLSGLSLILGGVYSGSAAKVYVPLAQNPTPVPTTPGLFEYTFTGILFTSEDDLQEGLTVITQSIEADSGLSADEKTAITNQLSLLVYESVDSDYSWTINGVSYTFHVRIVTSSGYIKVSYQR